MKTNLPNIHYRAIHLGVEKLPVDIFPFRYYYPVPYPGGYARRRVAVLQERPMTAPIAMRSVSPPYYPPEGVRGPCHPSWATEVLYHPPTPQVIRWVGEKSGSVECYCFLGGLFGGQVGGSAAGDISRACEDACWEGDETCSVGENP